MKHLLRVLPFILASLAATAAFGAVPPIGVTVLDSGGNVAFKGATSADGQFSAGKLTAGHYVVQFSSKSAPKNSQYGFVVSAGQKKVTSNAVGAEMLHGAGIAMKIDVGAGHSISAEVTKEKDVVMKGGKKMVYIPPELGSRVGRWVEEDSPESLAAKGTQRNKAKSIGAGLKDR